MAGDYSTWAVDTILNHFFRGTQPAAIATPYIGLFSTMPATKAGAGTELVTGSSPGYARVAGTFSAPSGTDPRQVATSADTLFPRATGDWLAAVGYGVWDAPVGGNLICFKTFGSPVTITNGNRGYFASGELTSTET